MPTCSRPREAGSIYLRDAKASQGWLFHRAAQNESQIPGEITNSSTESRFDSKFLCWKASPRTSSLTSTRKLELGLEPRPLTKLSASPSRQENLSEFTGSSGSGEAGYHLESEKVSGDD